DPGAPARAREPVLGEGAARALGDARLDERRLEERAPDRVDVRERVAESQRRGLRREVGDPRQRRREEAQAEERQRRQHHAEAPARAPVLVAGVRDRDYDLAAGRALGLADRGGEPCALRLVEERARAHRLPAPRGAAAAEAAASAGEAAAIVAAAEASAP